jgi:hypothetical protein
MRHATLVLLAVLALAPPAHAQMMSDLPIGRYVIDVRAALPKVPSSAELAAPYGLAAADLPGLGLGLDVGAHVYPVRWRFVTFGVGADVAIGRAHAGVVTAADGTTTGADVTARFTAVSPQVSVNFGSAAGWSYLSGGLGFSTLGVETATTSPTAIAPRRKTLNFGGGGRWFLRDRMAFTFDLRFYAMNPIAAETDILQSPRLRLMVFSAGVSFR